MASAIQINAAGNVIAGYGFNVNPPFLTKVAQFKNLKTVTLLSQIYAQLAGTLPLISNNLYPIIDALGTGLVKERFLIDLWPSNVTPICSASVSYHHGSVSNTESFINTLVNQANWPLANGNSGFSSAYLGVFSTCLSKYDIIGAINVLQNKTYGQTGLNYDNTLDITTNGINTDGPLLANVVANWGTMYDINNMSLIGDPYVFGQNLLNQGLGTYGNIAGQLTAAGLDISDITKPTQNSSGTSIQSTVRTRPSPFGDIHLPTLNSVDVSIPITGTSPTVVVNIYKSVTKTNLSAIISATGITPGGSTTITSLADFLDYPKVVNPGYTNELKSLGITSLSSLGSYIQRIVGKSTFPTWKDMSLFLSNIHIPPQLSTVGGSSLQSVVSHNAITTINSAVGTGTGNFSHRIITDYLGAMEGNPYTQLLTTIISNYPQIAVGVENTMSALYSAVVAYITQYLAYLADQAKPYPPGPTGSPPMPSTAPVSAAASAVNTALSHVSKIAPYHTAVTAFLTAISRLVTEVNNISGDSITNVADKNALINFSQSVGNDGSDSTVTDSYQFFANVITHDYHGDSIKLAISESINTSKLNSAGVPMNNNTSPASIVAQSNIQNIPITSYINQNL
jgi:hypothetical protein